MSNPLNFLLDDLSQRVMTNCVFVFKAKDGKKVTLAAHQNVLGASSEVFREMFFGPQTSPDEIVITDVSHSCFEKLLWTIYGKEFTIENGDAAFELYEAAEKYNISSAREIARKYMINTNDISTASLYFKAGVLFQDQQLETASKDVFASEIFNLTKVPNFFGSTDKIVQENGFKVDEDDCIAALGVALQPFKDSITKEDNLNDRIDKTLQLIRFLTTETGHLFVSIISPSVAKYECSLNYVPPKGTLEDLKKHLITYLNCAKYKNPSGIIGFGDTPNICSCKTHNIGLVLSPVVVTQLMEKYKMGGLEKYTLEDVQAIYKEFKQVLSQQTQFLDTPPLGTIFSSRDFTFSDPANIFQP